MAEDRPHSGVIFADEHTIKPNAPSALAAAIAVFAREIGNQDTTNLVRHLRPDR
jgi:hemoglobin-like flavoprotein